MSLFNTLRSHLFPVITQKDILLPQLPQTSDLLKNTSNGFKGAPSLLFRRARLCGWLGGQGLRRRPCRWRVEGAGAVRRAEQVGIDQPFPCRRQPRVQVRRRRRLCASGHQGRLQPLQHGQPHRHVQGQRRHRAAVKLRPALLHQRHPWELRQGRAPHRRRHVREARSSPCVCARPGCRARSVPSGRRPRRGTCPFACAGKGCRREDGWRQFRASWRSPRGGARWVLSSFFGIVGAFFD